MPRKGSQTWGEVGVRNAGFRATLRALQFALAWGLATAELGREPESVEELAATMELSVRTAYRDQEAFRKAFPELDSPTVLNSLTHAQERYDEAWRRLRKDTKAAASEIQHMTFWLGSQTVQAGAT